MGIGEIIGWLIMGVIVGAIARLLLPGRDPMGCIMTAVLGIVGSVVGGVIGRLIFGAPRGEGYFTPTPSWILSIIGAIVVLLIWRMMRRRA